MKTISIPSREVTQGQIWAVLPGSSELPKAVLEADTLLVPDRFPLVPTRRLVVLVPPGEIDESALAHRVWQLAACSDVSVLYLALAPDAALTAYQRRRLVILSALTIDPPIRAETAIYNQRNWSKALRQTLQPGDLLVCAAEDHTTGFFRRQPLGKRLSSDLGVPVYEFGDLQVKPEPAFQSRLKNVFAWIAAVALLAAFFWLQFAIDRSVARPQSTILLYLSVLVELYGLWKINEWIG